MQNIPKAYAEEVKILYMNKGKAVMFFDGDVWRYGHMKKFSVKEYHVIVELSGGAEYTKHINDIIIVEDVL